MSKHTPGPWSLEFVGNTEPSGTGHDLWDVMGPNLLVSVAENVHDRNARLIAAAPELLSTLHSVEALLDSLWTATVTSAAGREQNKQLKKLALEQVRSAIAKAEGPAPKSGPAL